jgi:hypothetical protein
MFFPIKKAHLTFAKGDSGKDHCWNAPILPNPPLKSKTSFVSKEGFSPSL